MNPESPFISMVVPTYNRADLLPATLRSLIDQQDSQFEILVVDDGSTDNTEQVVRSIADPRITYYRKQNAERGAARNFGAGKARGQYVNFFDSDDVAYPNHLSVARETIEKFKSPEIFHLAYDIKNPEGGLLREANRFPPTINQELINGNHMSCNGVFIRRDIILQIPFSENRALSGSEDYALWLKLASRFPVYCVNTITSTVINHEQRSVLQINKAKLLQRLDILQEEVMSDSQFIQRYGSETGIFRSCLQLYIALHLAMAGNPKRDCWVHLVRALQFKPSMLFSYRFMATLKNILI